jgi:putative toxin-antitoxin system antitoxin component (TIGR02293 family)
MKTTATRAHPKLGSVSRGGRAFGRAAVKAPRSFHPTLDRIREGIPLAEFESLAVKLGLTQEEFGRKIGISVPTLSRRKKRASPLGPEHSDRLLRFQRLFDQAVKLFEGNEAHAREWLRTPEPALGNLEPSEVAETEAGAREVEKVLGRLEHGELT